MSDALAASPLARALGLALVQFLWQGAAVGGSTALLLIGLRRTSAQLRYVVACVGLVMMLAMLIATVGRYLRETMTPSARDAVVLITTPGATQTHTMTAVSPAWASTSQIPNPFDQWLEAQLPYVVLVWGAGVVVLALHLLSGWARVRRVRRRATPLAASNWPEVVRALADQIGLRRRIRLLESAIIEVPAVIGWLRPAIVIPVSALTGLSPTHLEVILAHELAHVRRGDYLINLLQCVIELLLFYHPAVWWVSGQIRLEREHCCDDVAVSLGADRETFARALTSLEEMRGKAPGLAMAARGGHLLIRIRRLVEPGFVAGPRLSGGFAMCVVLTVLLLAMSNRFSAMPAAADRFHDSVSARPISLRTVASAQPLPRPARAEGPASAAHRPRANAIAPVAPDSPVLPLGQSTRGNLVGVVRDEQGGVMPGAPVVISSLVAPDTRVIMTDNRGQFFTDLVGGVYDVTVSVPGFRTLRSRLRVMPNDTVTADIRLKVGGVTETITTRAPLAPTVAVGASQTGPIQARSQTAADYFDLAKLYYQQRRLSEAEVATARALELLRAEVPETPSTPSPSVDPTGPVRIGGNIKGPRKIRDVRPMYPADALAAGVEGTVILEAFIATNGTVRDAQILRGVPMLDDAALGAVRQWLFTPTELNGQPVEVVMTVSITFVAR